jgi:hypothetical protein
MERLCSCSMAMILFDGTRLGEAPWNEELRGEACTNIFECLCIGLAFWDHYGRVYLQSCLRYAWRDGAEL